MKKIVKKMVALVLALLVVVSAQPSVLAKAATSSEYDRSAEVTIEKEDGTYICKMQSTTDLSSYRLDMTNEATNETTTLEFKDGIASTYSGTEIVNQVNYNPSIEAYEENSVSYRSFGGKTVCIIPTLAGNNLWYQVGDGGSDVGYMVMGCVATYRVPADACGDCANFRNKILESNAHCGASGLSAVSSMAAAATILTAGIPGAGAVAGLLGITVAAAKELIQACTAEESAHNSYDIAKGYGTQI